jgi:zinc transporter ZupT
VGATVAVPWEPLVLWAAVTFATPLAVAALPLSRRIVGDRTIHVMLGLSAGLLLGICLVNILPESFALLGSGSPMLVAGGVFAGFFVLLLVEFFVLHGGGEDHHFGKGPAARPFGALALGALVFHGALDGLVIPLAFSINVAAGTAVTLAIALHQIPDSFAAVSIALAAGFDRRRSARFVLISAADTPLGMLLGLTLLSFGVGFLPFALAFAAGTFLFVAAVDLIPELQHRSRSPLVAVMILVGFLAVAVLTALLPGA